MTEEEQKLLDAIEQNPNDAPALYNYAHFLRTVKNDYRSAEEYYQRAIDAAPDEPSYRVQFANFLKDVQRDYTRAEECYLK